MVLINESSDELVGAKEKTQEHLIILKTSLDDLEELGDILTEMLERQQVVQVLSYFCISFNNCDSFGASSAIIGREYRAPNAFTPESGYSRRTIP